MSDLNKRLDIIERQLQIIAHNQSPVFGNSAGARNDEVDLRELWNVLWRGKWWIISVTFLFAVVGVFYALSLPNMYRSEGVYAPVQKQNNSGGLSSQYGGLAAIAGISLGGGESSDIDQAIALVSSWPFLESIIKKNNLKPLLLGVNGWDEDTDTFSWNSEVFDSKNNIWMQKDSELKSFEPTSYEAYKSFVKLLSVNFNNKTSMLVVSVDHYSPKVAKEWVELVVRELNELFQLKDMSDSQRNIAYLKGEVSKTSVMGMQSVLYGMIEHEMQNLMLAEVSDEYLLETIVVPKISEDRDSPNRAFIVVIAILAGGFLSVLIVVSRFFLTLGDDSE